MIHLGNGVLSSDPWQKIRKTGANSYIRRMFKAIEFCIPMKGTKRPTGSDWLHEVSTRATDWGIVVAVRAARALARYHKPR